MPRDPPSTIATLPVSLRSSLILGSIIDQSVHNGPRERAKAFSKSSPRFQAFDDKSCLSPKRCGVDASTSRELDALHRHLDERSNPHCIEGLVLDRLRALFAPGAEVSDAVAPLGLDAATQRAVLDRSAKLAERWTKLASLELRELVRSLVQQIQIGEAQILVWL